MGLLDKLITGTYKNAKKVPLYPRTRKQVFAEIFRYRKSTLVQVSLLIFLLAIPTAVLLSLGFLYKGMLPTFIEEGSIELPVPEDADLSLLVLRFRTDNLFFLISFATNAILFLGVAGGVRVLQLLVWGEPVSVGYDFGQGIKSNWLFCLLSSLLVSIALFFANFVIHYYVISQTYAVVKGICIAIGSLVAFLVLGALMFAIPHGNLYTLSFFKTWKNAFLLFFHSFFKNVGILLLAALPLLLLLIPNVIVQTVLSILLLLLYPSYALILCILNANTAFDRFLNVGQNAAIAGKGIVWEEDGEDKVER